jgi:hypothetical protein
MAWGKIGATFILLSGAVLCTNAGAEQTAARHRNANFVEASFSTSDVPRQSLAHAAVASTDMRPQDNTLSRQDLFGLMILFSLPNKHPQ